MRYFCAFAIAALSAWWFGLVIGVGWSLAWWGGSAWNPASASALIAPVGAAGNRVATRATRDLPESDVRPEAIVSGDAAVAAEPPCDPMRTVFERAVGATFPVILVNPTDSEDRQPRVGGTAALVSRNGYFLTAYHVINKPVTQLAVRRQCLKHHDLRFLDDLPVRVVAIAPEIDVALLKLDRVSAELPPYRFRAFCGHQPRKGEKLWHFGQRTRWAVGRTIDSNYSAVGHSGLTRVRAASNFGDSGGPFVTPGGWLVGTLLSITTEGKRDAFFIPACQALDSLARSIHIEF